MSIKSGLPLVTPSWRWISGSGVQHLCPQRVWTARFAHLVEDELAVEELGPSRSVDFAPSISTCNCEGKSVRAQGGRGGDLDLRPDWSTTEVEPKASPRLENDLRSVLQRRVPRERRWRTAPGELGEGAVRLRPRLRRVLRLRSLPQFRCTAVDLD